MDEVPLNRDDTIPHIEFNIRNKGQEFEYYYDMWDLALSVYESRPEEHRFGDFKEWYGRLMGLEDLDRLEIMIYDSCGNDLIAAAVLTEVEDHHYGQQLSEVFKVTDGTWEAAKCLVMAYRAVGESLGVSEYISTTYTKSGYIRKLRGLNVIHR